MELIDLEPCESGKHKFVPLGDPHAKSEIVSRIVMRAFCQGCGNMIDLVLVDNIPPTSPQTLTK